MEIAFESVNVRSVSRDISVFLKERTRFVSCSFISYINLIIKRSLYMLHVVVILIIK